MAVKTAEQRAAAAAATARWREKPENMERQRAYLKKYRQENAEALRERQLIIKFGITAAQYDALLVEQGGTCAMCPATALTSGKRLAVDHDHQTGEVRGLICDLCNRALGLLNDDIDRLLAGVVYLLTAGAKK